MAVKKTSKKSPAKKQAKKVAKKAVKKSPKQVAKSDSPFANSGTRLHDILPSDNYREFMKHGWADSSLKNVTAHESVAFTIKRRSELSKDYKGWRIVLPAGNLKVRSNDDDYRFRAHSAFAWFTGIGAADAVPDSVLVMEPTSKGHEALLFIHPRSPRDTDEFYRNAKHGEFWVGRRLTQSETEKRYGISVRHIDTLPAFLKKSRKTVSIPGEDKAIDKLIKGKPEDHKAFITHISEMRAVKDEYEINEMKKAIATTARGFDDMVSNLKRAVKSPRGERVLEGTFISRAIEEGNDTGYPTIVASGAHACVLHWIRNDGKVKNGDLILIDAGAETDAYYTADITRTVPVSGKFTKAQRRIYDLVYAAQEAAMLVARPGVEYGEMHKAAQRVFAHGLEELGVLPMSAEECLKVENGLQRRWTVHSTGHHLGIDVHDCAQARKENYTLGKLKEGMILTIEPGLYIQEDDELFPPEYRGIGVRIEDDFLITKNGNINLSGGIPRHADDVEKWVRKLS